MGFGGGSQGTCEQSAHREMGLSEQDRPQFALDFLRKSCSFFSQTLMCLIPTLWFLFLPEKIWALILFRVQCISEEHYWLDIPIGTSERPWKRLIRLKKYPQTTYPGFNKSKIFEDRRAWLDSILYLPERGPLSS